MQIPFSQHEKHAVRRRKIKIKFIAKNHQVWPGWTLIIRRERYTPRADISFSIQKEQNIPSKDKWAIITVLCIIQASDLIRLVDYIFLYSDRAGLRFVGTLWHWMAHLSRTWGICSEISRRMPFWQKNNCGVTQTWCRFFQIGFFFIKKLILGWTSLNFWRFFSLEYFISFEMDNSGQRDGMSPWPCKLASEHDPIFPCGFSNSTPTTSVSIFTNKNNPGLLFISKHRF